MEDPQNLYEMLDQLSKNTLATVFKAKDKKTNETVALKLMDLGDAAENDADMKAIIVEVQALAKKPAPNLVQYKAARQKGSTRWIALEYCEGGSVLDAVKSASLDEQQLSVILRSALVALDYLHSNGTAHFAVKASNILLSTSGVKLTDFGEFEKLSHKMSKSYTFLNSPFWMAPEIVQQDGGSESEEGPESDIWALGIAAIEMATGAAPYSDLNPMKAMFLILNQPPPQLPEKFSPVFRSFVAACLNKTASQRPKAKDLLKHEFVAKAAAITDKVVADLMVARQKAAAEEAAKKRSSGSPAPQQSTLQTVIYPSLARLLQACQNEDQTLAALVAIKQGFDGVEKVKNGISYTFVQHLIDVLKKSPN